MGKITLKEFVWWAKNNPSNVVCRLVDLKDVKKWIKKYENRKA